MVATGSSVSVLPENSDDSFEIFDSFFQSCISLD